MKKKTIILSVSAAALLILVSLTSVVGTQSTKSYAEKNTASSPLFTVRSYQSSNIKQPSTFSSAYLGQNNEPGLFFSEKPILLILINQAMKTIEQDPQMFINLLNKAQRLPAFSTTMKKYDISPEDYTKYINKIKCDPSVYTQELEKALQVIIIEEDNVNSPRKPLSLNTSSNPLACVITVLVLLPVFLILTLLIATITIITCLNVNGCFETLFNSFIQELIPLH